MDYSNFSIESTFEANYLSISMPVDSKLDEIAVNVINDDCPSFLIPFKLISVNDQNILRYKLLNSIALEYMNMRMTKKDFVHLFMELLNPMVNGKDYFLDYHCLCFDSRYVYLDSKSGKALFIYIPEGSYRSGDKEISEFLTDVFKRADITDDADFQVRLYKLFSNENLTISTLYQFFGDEEKKMGFSQSASLGQAGRPYSVQQQTATGYQPPIQNQTTVQNQPQVTVATSPIVQNKPPFQNPAQAPVQQVNVSSAPVSKTVPNQVAQAASEDKTDAMMALFDGGKKKDNKKNKDKSSTQKKSQNSQPASEKKSGGFPFNLSFGGKKQSNTSAPASVPVTAQVQNPVPLMQTQAQPVAAQYQQVQPQMAQVSYGIVGYQAVDAGHTEDATEIFEEDVVAGSSYMELIDSMIPGAPPMISLAFDKPFIELGRISSDQNRPDVAFGKDFTRIGRRHARIEKNSNGYSVIDLGSQNHTLLNQMRLVPNTAYPLKDGDILCLTESKPVRYKVHIL